MSEAIEPEVLDREDENETPAKSRREVAVAAQPSTIAPWAPSALAEMSDEEFERRLVLATKERERIARIQRSVMKEGVDYGVIPGTDKPTIFKPGCEILDKLAGYVPSFDVTREIGDGITAPFIRYQVKCRLYRADGTLVGEGDGAANSWETKHRYRYAKRVCPKCSSESIIKGKDEYGGGWLCWKNKGGCGAKFPDGSAEIEGQAAMTENTDPHDLDNTLLKMAKKRGRADATLTAHAASGIFTQDLEDMPSDPAPAKKVARRQAAARTEDTPEPAERLITEAQGKRLWALAAERAKKLGDHVDRTDIVRDTLASFGIEHTNEIPWRHYDAICAHVQSWDPPVAEAGTTDEGF